MCDDCNVLALTDKEKWSRRKKKLISFLIFHKYNSKICQKEIWNSLKFCRISIMGVGSVTRRRIHDDLRYRLAIPLPRFIKDSIGSQNNDAIPPRPCGLFRSTAALPLISSSFSHSSSLSASPRRNLLRFLLLRILLLFSSSLSSSPTSSHLPSLHLFFSLYLSAGQVT